MTLEPRASAASEATVIDVSDLIARELRLFPLRKGSKLPAIEKFPDLASYDPDAYAGWWAKGYNVGVATGRGLLVVDVDTKGKPGLEEWDKLCAAHELTVSTFTVRTPTGGLHFYFHGSGRQTASFLAPGIDTRCEGGFVVGPGSTVKAGVYEVVNDAQIAVLPDALALLLDGTNRSVDQEPVAEIDSPRSVDAAIRYLTDEAEPAVEGAGGNQTTFKVAARLKDLGVSRSRASDLMAEHWNPECMPPWSVPELKRIVRNAYVYADAQPPGVDSPDVMFIGLEPEAPWVITPYDYRWEENIPPRPWVIPGWALRGHLSLLLGSGSAGKSLLSLLLAASVTSSRAIADYAVRESGRVVVMNKEDDKDEVARRSSAMRQVHKLTRDETKPLALLNMNMDTRLVVRNRMGQLVPHHVDYLVNLLKRLEAKMLVLDPLTELHQADENDNVEMMYVASVLRQVARDANCAVVVVHHIRKPSNAKDSGYAGDMYSGRGAGALVNAARVVKTITGMSDDEAERFGHTTDSWAWSRVDDAKQNLAALSRTPDWFVREVVNTGPDTSATLKRANPMDGLRREIMELGDILVRAAENGVCPMKDALKAVGEESMWCDDNPKVLKKRLLSFFRKPMKVGDVLVRYAKSGADESFYVSPDDTSRT